MKIPFYPAHSSNYTKGRTSKISQITFHHTAAENTTLRFLWGDPDRNGSSTYFAGNKGNEQYVKEADTPWTDGNRASNARAITIETRGDWRFGYYNQDTLDNLIELVRDIRTRYPGIGYKIHRSVSNRSTVCPGDLPVELVWKLSDPKNATEKPSAELRLDIPDKKVILTKDTNVWDMSFTKFNKAKAVTALRKGTVIDVVGEYDHPLSSTDYYLSKYSWDKGLNNGISKDDCEDYVEPTVKVPKNTKAIDNPTKPESVTSPKGGAGEIPVLPVDPNGEPVNKIRINMLSTIYEKLVAGNQKAIVAFILTMLTGLGLQVGGVNIINATVSELITSVLTSVITAGSVWLQANK